jgi:hypothetical protein
MVYAILFAVAIALNIGCKKSLLLTLVVGLSALIPMQIALDGIHSFSVFINHEVSQYYLWFAICLGFESFKTLLACQLKIRLSYPIVFLCSLMSICHLTLFFVDNLLPHKIIVPILEHLEILSCILFSPIILKYLKRKVTCQ